MLKVLQGAGNDLCSGGVLSGVADAWRCLLLVKGNLHEPEAQCQFKQLFLQQCVAD